MRRYRYWLIGLVGVAALVGGSVAFYYKFVDTAYSGAEFYADTQVVAVKTEPGVIAQVEFQSQPGRVTLCLLRGEPHGIVTTDHGWSQRLYIDTSQPSNGERIELDRIDGRLAFTAFDGRRFGEVGDGGIRGHIQIESARQDRIVAEYDITIDAVYRRPYETHRLNEDVVFRGRSTFRLRPRRDGVFTGDVWSRPSPLNK